MMKTKSLITSLVTSLVAMLFAFTSCEPEAVPVVLNVETASMVVGDTLQLKANNATAGTWTVSDGAVARVEAGMVIALAEGSTSVTATIGSVTSEPCLITVDKAPILPLTLNYDTYTFRVGDTIRLTTNEAILGTWSVEDALIASVNDGEVVGLAEGTTSVMVSMEGYTTATCVVTVFPKLIVPVFLDKNTYTLEVGESFQIFANERTDGVWISSDEAVVTVEAGMLTAVAVGVADITATIDGATSSPCVVTVNAAREAKPVLENPSAGMITMAIRLPVDMNCNAPILAGSVEGTTWGPDTYEAGVSEDMIVFEQVAGKTNWYSATFAVVTGNEFKPCAVTAEGGSNWAFQWKTFEAMGAVTPAIDLQESYGDYQCKIVDADVLAVEGAVVYYDIISFKANPCVTF